MSQRNAEHRGRGLRPSLLLALPLVRTGLALVALVLISGCGYRAGLAPSIPIKVNGVATGEQRSVETIGVEIFDNETLLPNLERDLHRAMSLAARRHLGLTVVSPSRADLVLRGSIKDFRRSGGARTGQNRVIETRERVTVLTQLVDRRGGQIVGASTAQAQVGTAIDVPGRAVNERLRAIENVADRSLLLLLAGLEYGVTRPGQNLTPRSADGTDRAANDGLGAPDGPLFPADGAGIPIESGATLPSGTGQGENEAP